MNGWPLRKIGEVVDFQNRRRIPLKSADRAKRPGPFPYYGASGIVDHIDDYIFEGRHLLISEDGENLRSRSTPIAFRVDGRFWVNNHAHIVTEKEAGILDFLEYALSVFDLNPFITGAAQPKLNKRTLAEIALPIPPREERLKINGLLNALTQKIELNRRMNATLEAMARALFRSWFVDFDPVHAKAAGEAPAHMDAATAALFPDRFSEDGLPEGWRVKPIGDAAEIVGGSTPSTKNAAFWEGGEFLWATPRDLSKLGTPILLDTERKITAEGVAQISSRQLPPGTLLLSSRAPIGYLAIARRPVSVNQGFIAMKETCALSSAYMLFWCQENMEVILSNANGSTFQEISKRNFRPLPAVVPPKAVLGAFNERAGRLIDLIASNEEQSRTLAALRDALLPKLMSGELRVREAEAQVAEAV